MQTYRNTPTVEKYDYFKKKKIEWIGFQFVGIRSIFVL